jgi:hypothetical protein
MVLVSFVCVFIYLFIYCWSNGYGSFVENLMVRTARIARPNLCVPMLDYRTVWWRSKHEHDVELGQA